MDEAGAVFTSVPPAATPAPHLGEVPALDEVSGNIACCFAMYHRGDVVPGHPWGGVSVNEVYRTEKHVWISSDKGHECGKGQHPPHHIEVFWAWHQGLSR